MSELNAEQIKKQMQEWCDNMCENACLKGESLNGRVHTCEICFPNTVKNALALIKELTEENERLKSLCEAKDDIIDKIAANSEEIGIVAIRAISETKANTVRKMQERLDGEHFVEHNEIKYGGGLIHKIIDQIAKEMLEGEG